ncbi:MAG: CHRD domain-containing protein [Pyrinomonadaceae bacterium]
MTEKTKISFKFSISMAAFLVGLLLLAAAWQAGPVYSAMAEDGPQTQMKKELAKRFRNYEVLQLHPREIQEQVRRTGHLEIKSGTQDFDLDLVVNDLRSSDYRARDVGPGGFVHDLPMNAPRTYKGNVAGRPRTQARFTIDENAFEGMIITEAETYFLEPERNYSQAAEASEYILYRATDVIQDGSRECAVTLGEKINQSAEGLVNKAEPEVFSPFKVVELATEADFDYVTSLGGATAANNEILSIMNQVEGIYEQQIGLTFTVVFQNTWTVSADPYSAADPVGALNEFTNYWNANFSNTPRDLAHMWTGRSIGGPAGIAWQGVVCRAPTAAYGISVRDSFPLFRISIPAHEMGHNFNATHPDGQAACNNTIMVSIATESNTLNFCQFSIDEITNYVNANPSCLSLAGPPPTVQFSQGSFSKSETGPSTNITVTRTGDTSGASSVDFRTEGNSYVACNVFNNLAVQNCDFILNSGTLNFAAGQTSRTFAIIINDDTYVEGNENLGLTLSNPVGATMGSPGTATLTILENDIPGNPSVARKTFIAALSSGQEAPPTGTTGKGGGVVQLDAAETGAQVGLLFSNLSSPQTDAHIHGPAAPGANAPIVFPLPLGTVINHPISPTGQQVLDLKAGLHYMNVHSSNFTGGETRGQLQWNPLNESVYLVTQHYYDFLGRLPDQGGLDFWVNSLTACGINVQCLRDQAVGVSNAFFFEPEYQQTASYVFLLYRAAYGNTQPFPNPDPNVTEAQKLPRYLTFVRDRAQVVGGTELANSQSALANAFVQRPEFIARYPLSLATGVQFVGVVLATIQSASGVDLSSQTNTLINHFNTGGRGRVMFHLANDYWNGCDRLPGSPAAPCAPAGFGAAVDNRPFIDAEYNRSFVYSQYSGYLRRDSDIGGFLFWLNQVSAAPPRNVAKQKAMVCSFITSDEYQFRFGDKAPRTNVECLP